MTAAIAEILLSKLDLSFLERKAGLVYAAKRPDFANQGGQWVANGESIWPVAGQVGGNPPTMWGDVSENTVWGNVEVWGDPGTAAACGDANFWKYLLPDSTKKGVAFFVDTAGVSLLGVDGPKLANLRFSFSLKLLVWLNAARLVEKEKAGLLTAYLAPFVVARLFGQHETTGLAITGLNEIIEGVNVERISELLKSAEMWQPFTFARNQALFLFPFDHMGFTISGTFIVNRKCLPELTITDQTYCIPE